MAKESGLAANVLECVVSGGQTGADRAGLDAALQLRIPCGGWCPKGRRADDGPIPAHYPLHESSKSNYLQRTEWNVRDSDGTLLLFWQLLIPKGGTAQTRDFALKHRKPCLEIDVSTEPEPSQLAAWCAANAVRVLNVAGPREGPECPVYRASLSFLLDALPACTCTLPGPVEEPGSVMMPACVADEVCGTAESSAATLLPEAGDQGDSMVAPVASVARRWKRKPAPSEEDNKTSNLNSF